MKIEENDIIIESWNELCDSLFVDSWNCSINRYRTDYAYRGLNDKSWKLENSFMRNCCNNPNLEYHMLRNFRKYAKMPDSGLFSSDWKVITIGQHYGLPTRLLDWTYSPFIAAHFATNDISRYDKDAVIWLLNFVKINHLLPPPFRTVLEQEKANAFTIEMIENAVPTINQFDRLTKDELLLFFEPPSIDDRIINQFAFFSAMSNPIAPLENWLSSHPDLYKRIIIPAQLKWEVRDKLDQANITERILFPGLDGLAKWLSRHYTPKID
ncbi:FRG domain-containing protein [Roseimarinus sediminis]|uniref:FRG domain-containing protein n=1 Tax=Roseimarinus sediminis TaxID=1610899 RepID=UPI003D20C264